MGKGVVFRAHGSIWRAVVMHKQRTYIWRVREIRVELCRADGDVGPCPARLCGCSCGAVSDLHARQGTDKGRWVGERHMRHGTCGGAGHLDDRA